MGMLFNLYSSLRRHALPCPLTCILPFLRHAHGVTRRQPWAEPKRRTDGSDHKTCMWGQQYARWSLSGSLATSLLPLTPAGHP